MHIDDRIQRIEPFLSFAGVGIWKLVHGTVKQHAVSLAELPIGSHRNPRLSVRIWSAYEFLT
ncbi:unannotated protein [freshwater metagenome]|uniref:Unannotated protein n=1 Tax=freshwater metagenome TaxID=449393 RepID=A0A6J6CAY6_9ZZZZ